MAKIKFYADMNAAKPWQSLRYSKPALPVSEAGHFFDPGSGYAVPLTAMAMDGLAALHMAYGRVNPTLPFTARSAKHAISKMAVAASFMVALNMGRARHLAGAVIDQSTDIRGWIADDRFANLHRMVIGSGRRYAADGGGHWWDLVRISDEWLSLSHLKPCDMRRPVASLKYAAAVVPAFIYTMPATAWFMFTIADLVENINKGLVDEQAVARLWEGIRKAADEAAGEFLIVSPDETKEAGDQESVQ